MSKRKSIYFVVKYVRAMNKQTHKQEMLEMVYLVDRVKNRDMDEATVILDLLESKVTKARYENMQDYDTALKYYQNKYPKKINPILEEYATIQGQLKELQEKMVAEAEAEVVEEVKKIPKPVAKNEVVDTEVKEVVKPKVKAKPKAKKEVDIDDTESVKPKAKKVTEDVKEEVTK